MTPVEQRGVPRIRDDRVRRDLGADDAARGAVVEIGVEGAVVEGDERTLRAPEVERDGTIENEGRRGRVRPGLVLLPLGDRLLAVTVFQGQARMSVAVDRKSVV